MYALRLFFFILHLVDIFTDCNFLMSASNVPVYWKIWMAFFILFPMMVTMLIVGDFIGGIKAIFGVYLIHDDEPLDIEDEDDYEQMDSDKKDRLQLQLESNDTLKAILIVFENVPQFILQTLIMLSMGGNLTILQIVSPIISIVSLLIADMHGKQAIRAHFVSMLIMIVGLIWLKFAVMERTDVRPIFLQFNTKLESEESNWRFM